MSRIHATPGPELSYSPQESHYFDPEQLQVELTRGYDICHGCRLCFNLCPSFPALFRYTDANDGDVTKLSQAESDTVVDLCFQCKICYVKCPYTPDDKHDFQLDFPGLMQRAKAVRVKQKGLGLRERLLGNPDLLGKMAGLTPALANLANRILPMRLVLEKVLGIHRHKLLPEFHGRSFMAWFRRGANGLPVNGDNGKVLYYPTCFVNYNSPEIGEAAVAVFSKNGLAVSCEYDTCCGMPALDSGDIATAQKQARANVEKLLPFARSDHAVLVNNPTCSMMMRKEYPKLLGTPEANELAKAVRDPMEYLHELRKEGRLNEDFKSTPGRINYHVPCHLRAQNIGYRSRDVMRRIGGTEIDLVTECCGHDGTWAMKQEFFDLSLEAGKKAFEGMRAREATLSTDCPLAAIQFKQALNTKPLHPLQILARAYRPDGFPQAVETTD